MNIRRAVLLLVLAVACGCSDRGRQPAIIALPDVAAAGSAEPNLAVATDGTVVLSWLEPAGERDTALRFAVLDGNAWTAPTTVASGDNWFVNWADFPSVVPIDDELWAAHWLVRSGDSPYAYDVAIAASADAGRSWGNAVTPHTDGTATEHGFVSLFPATGGIGALWLDGRNMAGGSHDDHGGGGMTLRSAVMSTHGTLLHQRLVDDLVCDCCQTDVAVGREGPVAVYRDRTAEEIRDIYVTRLLDGDWSEGVAVANDGWEIAGCPVNGPALAARDSDIAVAWFTAPENVPAVKVAFSSDHGRSFATAINVAAAPALGRVGVELLDDGNALVSWLHKLPDGVAEIRLQRVAPAGKKYRPVTVARTSAGRMSGFPQLALADDDIVVAWTDSDDARTHVRSARLPRSLLSTPD